MTGLDPSRWRDMPGMPKLLEALGAPDGHTRLVGGAVRDWLLGCVVSDIDLATRLTPDQVMARLGAAGIKVVPTGVAHGTVTAVAGGRPHEVTTLRRDIATDGRHATVAFTDDWQADAARRDFTINALYADAETGAVSDYFGGLGDLGGRRVRFIGEPMARIAEDHLRILRFFRFSARYADAPDPEGVAACAARANDLMALSRERIRDELLKTLALPDPSDTVDVMAAHRIFAPVVPEVTVDGVARMRALIAAEQQAGAAPDAIRRLAALLPADAAVVDAVAVRLRLSKVDRARLVLAADRGPVPGDPLALAYVLGAPATLDRLLLTGDPRACDWVGPLRRWTRPRLPVSGKDLIAMGLPPGPAVSAHLAEVEQRWAAAGFPANREASMAIARAVLGKR